MSETSSESGSEASIEAMRHFPIFFYEYIRATERVEGLDHSVFLNAHVQRIKNQIEWLSEAERFDQERQWLALDRFRVPLSAYLYNERFEITETAIVFYACVLELDTGFWTSPFSQSQPSPADRPVMIDIV